MAPVTGSISIDAGPEAVLGILLDVAAYPSWQHGYERVEIQEADELGRPLQVKWHVTAMGQKASHSVRYVYTAPNRFEYHLFESEVTTRYDFLCSVDPAPDGTSEVTVSQELALKWPMPKRLLERMGRKGIDSLLAALKTRAEDS
jgi:hypothetical protein